MWRRTPVWVAAAVVGVLAVGGAGALYALDERDDDRPWSASDGRYADDRDGQDDDGDVRGAGLAADRDRDDRDERDDWDDRDGRDRDDRDDRDWDDRDRDRSDRDRDDQDRDDQDRDDSDGHRDADDVPLTDAEVAAVTGAALAEAGGGTVTDVDRSDDPGHAFEVDVRLENGDELEVRLDGDYAVVSTQLDPADRG